MSQATTTLTRTGLQEAFARENIDARIFFRPPSSLPMFTERRPNWHARELPTRAISLPSYHDVEESDLDRMVATLESVCHA